nr:PREDICTED: uncharacterized protein LOC109044445 [Bemisia tabaci]
MRRNSTGSSGLTNRFRGSFSGFSFRWGSSRNSNGAGPSTRRSSRSMSPDLQVLDSPPPVFRQRQSQPYQTQSFRVPLSKVYGSTTFASKYEKVVNKFREISTSEGEQIITADDLTEKKTALLQRVNTDLCNDAVNRRRAGNNCVLAFMEFMKIAKPWRGPCKEAFMGWCQPYGPPDAPVWKCSFFIKTSESSDGLTVAGYSHTMEDCVGRLSPEQFQEDLNKALS